MARPVGLASLLMLTVALIGCGGGGRSAHTAADQVGFGVRMAERGLWSEALFRFEQARQMGAGNDVEVLNNLAVAHEALGNFEEALAFYRQALSLAPGNRDLKANYDRFVSFYESFRAQAPAEGQAASAGAAPREPAADSGSPGPPAGPGGGDAPLVPGANEPPPVPDPDPDPDGDPPRAGESPGGLRHV